MSAEIENGAIILARVIRESDIWNDKPAWWFKTWVYILTQVNHKDDKRFKRGSGFFTMNKMYEQCFLQNDHVKYRTIDNVIRYLKSNDMITTQKTTRGMFITVCNYELYQDLKNYKNDTKKSFETTRKRHENDTINKNEKNEKNNNNNFCRQVINMTNDILGKNYKHIESNYKPIRARMNETSYTLEDFQRVILTKKRDVYFIANPKYYNPSTLFGTKFEKYLNENQAKAFDEA